MTNIQYEDFYENSADGKKIAITHWPVGTTIKKKKPKMVIVWVHGFAEHRNRYHHFAAFLNKNFIALIAVDLRGHGESAGPRGHINKYEEYFWDVEVAMKKAKELYPNEVIILGSHSHGGLVTSRFAESFSSSVVYKALILSAPFFKLKLEVPAWKKAVSKLMSSFFGSLALKNEIKTEDLTHNIEIANAYGTDPLIFEVARARWFSEVLENQEIAIEKAGTIGLPVLVLHGGDDRMVNIEGSRDFYKNLKSANCKMIEYEGFYHEILNELEREKVYKDILAWLKKIIS